MKSKYKDSPIHKKANELFETIIAITDLFPEEDIHLNIIKGQMLSDAMLIITKLSGAESVKIYDLKVENAVFIRKAARDLIVAYHSLEMFEFEELDYYNIIKRQLEEFRLLFIDWVQEFNPKHFITDAWGLLNPPGIPYDYEQSDDELDFLEDDDNDELF